MRYYLDSPSDANDRGNRQAGVVPGSGIHGPWSFTDAATNAPYQVSLFDNPDGHFYVPVGAKLKDETQMIGWQSYLLKERLVGFVGLRRDDVRTYGLMLEDIERQDYRVPGDRAGLYRGYEATRFG